MSRQARDQIIDLTDVIEEGHPERPNLQPSKSSASDSGEMLDDLDLEREIDQIFADLGPRTSRDDTSPRKQHAEDPDPLDLDDLFANPEQSMTSPVRKDGPAGAAEKPDQAADLQDDFEDLFVQRSPGVQNTRADSDPGTVADAEHPEMNLTDPASGHRDSGLKPTEDVPFSVAAKGREHSTNDQSGEPSMMDTILRRLDQLESRLEEQGHPEQPHPDVDSLLEQAASRFDSRMEASLQDLRQVGSQTQGELELLRQADQAAESRMSEESKRLEELLEQIKTDQERHLEQVTSVMRAEMAKMIEEAAEELRAHLTGHAETRFSLFSERLDALQNRIPEPDDQPGDSGNALEEREQRLAQTLRGEIQDLRTEWESQRKALAGDLENCLSYWTRLQERFNAIQEEWSVLREKPDFGSPDQQHDDGDSSSVAIQFAQLRDELLREIHRAVPEAAAEIIREEIQALSQEES